MDEKQEVFRRLFDLQKELFEHVRHRLGHDHAHPRQAPILGLLLTMDGVSQADLVRKLGVSAATVAVSIARLEKLGYVTRERNQHNQRANVLQLTPEGRAEATALQSAMCAACTDALGGLTSDEIVVLSTLCARMTSNLRAVDASDRSEHSPS